MTVEYICGSMMYVVMYVG